MQAALPAAAGRLTDGVVSLRAPPAGDAGTFAGYRRTRRRLVEDCFELPGFSTPDEMASTIRGEVNAEIFAGIAGGRPGRDPVAGGAADGVLPGPDLALQDDRRGGGAFPICDL